MARAFFIMATNSYDRIVDSAVNAASAFQIGDGIEGTFFENFLLPGEVQQREFGQQVALQQMQNEWNSEGAKMQRMKESGINANVAAAGIAGAGNAPSMGSPNSAIGAGAQSMQAAAGAGEALNNAVNAGVNAYEKFSLTQAAKEEKKAHVREMLSSALHNDWLAYSISELLPLQKDNERADTYLKLANYRNARAEYRNIRKKYDEMQANIDYIHEQERLALKQGNLVDAEKLKVDAQTAGIELDNYQKEQDKLFREKHGYNPNNPVDVSLMNSFVDDNDDVVNAIGESVKSMSYNDKKGFNQAEIEDAYKKAFEDAKANADVAAMFKEYNADVDAWKDIFVDMWKEAFENPSDIKGAAAKFINQFITLIGQLQASSHHSGSPSGNRIGPHDKPSAGGRYGK